MSTRLHCMPTGLGFGCFMIGQSTNKLPWSRSLSISHNRYGTQERTIPLAPSAYSATVCSSTRRLTTAADLNFMGLSEHRSEESVSQTKDESMAMNQGQDELR